MEEVLLINELLKCKYLWNDYSISIQKITRNDSNNHFKRSFVSFKMSDYDDDFGFGGDYDNDDNETNDNNTVVNNELDVLHSVVSRQSFDQTIYSGKADDKTQRDESIAPTEVQGHRSIRYKLLKEMYIKNDYLTFDFIV